MDFYYTPASPPCRSVLLLAKKLGIELNKKLVNTAAGEQLKPEFVKINPQHTVPTLVDNGFSVWESRAILVYLVEKYGKDDSLYPKDPQQRALVNQRLYFDMGTLYQSFSQYFVEVFIQKKPENLEKIEAAFGFLNTFLEGEKYVAGNKLTVADISIVTNVSSLISLVPSVDLAKFPNVKKWYDNTKNEIPGWAENEEGNEMLKQFIKTKFGA